MHYDKYYDLCKEEYNKHFPETKGVSIYSSPLEIYQPDFFSDVFNTTVKTLADNIKRDLNLIKDDLMPKHPNIFKYKKELETLSKELVPMLEKTRYGCYLYVDKIYIYRTAPIKERESSYIWHHDNNPDEILKNCIYLNKVTEKNSPFEYLMDSNKKPHVKESTRTGKNNWISKNTRINEEVNRLINNKKYISNKVVGNRGLVTSFLNNVAHRANPSIEGYRDVINIRVKPTLHKTDEYINKRWTTSFEASGVVDKDPRKDWRHYIEL